MVPMATACEEADGFQITSITMCGGEETTTWPYPTTVALLTAKRGSNDPKYRDVIQATAAMITATKHAINHFTDKRVNIRLQSAVYFRVFRRVCRRTLQGVNRNFWDKNPGWPKNP